MEQTQETAAQRYRKTDKCKNARKKYYETKGKNTSHEYYMKNREKIIERSKERYTMLKNNLNIDLTSQNDE
jgi:hypothetical protein